MSIFIFIKMVMNMMFLMLLMFFPVANDVIVELMLRV